MKEPNPYEVSSSNFDINTSTPEVPTRSQLIPMWIKVFGGLFVVFALLTFLSVGLGLVGILDTASLSLYGLEAEESIFSPISLFIVALTIAHGIVALGLLLKTDWGLKACQGVGYLSLVICLYTSFNHETEYSLYIRLELFVLAFYLAKLIRIEKDWYAPSNMGKPENASQLSKSAA